ncbi:hypothetical protein NITGR_10042 [Nitrospina gracilis 3/211]|uniref:Uncharacterized protein n=1 Tax=Nitrospina gracilis (strain 3/211) TaxID=1266370 RepID=M1YFI3_NITG3|nr:MULTISPECIES: hypothetical protein [Nitrospina]MCF8722345.1 hypothetical protein [Nitrospina sp. Nb-3]CCQ89185.1 hypothetical protein NITGR_10042 [Nitrospina gracilis 3/211]
MDGIITEQSIMGAVIMLLGIGLLNLCNRIEHKEYMARTDPREKWGFLDGQKKDEMKKRSIRGTLMALAGAGFSLWGFVILVIHFSSLE